MLSRKRKRKLLKLPQLKRVKLQRMDSVLLLHQTKFFLLQIYLQNALKKCYLSFFSRKQFFGTYSLSPRIFYFVSLSPSTEFQRRIMPSFYHLWRKYPALSFIVRTYAPVVVRHLRIDICGSKKSARKIWFAKVSLPLGYLYFLCLCSHKIFFLEQAEGENETNWGETTNTTNF